MPIWGHRSEIFMHYNLLLSEIALSGVFDILGSRRSGHDRRIQIESTHLVVLLNLTKNFLCVE